MLGYFFIKDTLPPLIKMCSKFSSKISVIADSKTPSGILGQELKQAKFSQLINILEKNKNNI